MVAKTDQQKPKYKTRPCLRWPRVVFCGMSLKAGTGEATRDKLISLGRYWVESGNLVVTGNRPGSDQLVAEGVNSIDPSKLEVYLPWDHFYPERLVQGNRIMTARRATLQDRQAAQACSTSTSWAVLSHAQRGARARFAQMLRGAARLEVFPRYHKPGWGEVGHAIKIAWYIGIQVFDALHGERIDPRPELIQLEI